MLVLGFLLRVWGRGHTQVCVQSSCPAESKKSRLSGPLTESVCTATPADEPRSAAWRWGGAAGGARGRPQAARPGSSPARERSARLNSAPGSAPSEGQRAARAEGEALDLGALWGGGHQSGCPRSSGYRKKTPERLLTRVVIKKSKRICGRGRRVTGAACHLRSQVLRAEPGPQSRRRSASRCSSPVPGPVASRSGVVVFTELSLASCAADRGLETVPETRAQGLSPPSSSSRCELRASRHHCGSRSGQFIEQPLTPTF